MKRIAVVVCAILAAFLLAACAKTAAPTPMPSEVTIIPSASPSPTPADSGGGSVVLPTGPLPDAPYTPPSSPPRYYAGPTQALIPSESYGRIVPYLGGWINAPYESWSNLYGLCDLSGKIICDPVYNDVKIVGDGKNSLYALTTYQPVWNGGSYVQNFVTTLCPADGRWAETYDNAEFDLSSTNWINGTVKFDYITVKKDGKWGVVGYDGKQLLPFEYADPVRFSDGLAAVLSGDGKSLYYIDITGKRVLGPYEAPEIDWPDDWGPQPPGVRTEDFIFCGGFALFYQDGQYGIIDKTGKVVITPEDGAKNDYRYSWDGDQLTVYNASEIAYTMMPDGTLKQNTPGTEFEVDGGFINYPGDGIILLPNGEYVVYRVNKWRVYEKEANLNVLDPVSDEMSGYPQYIDLNGAGVIVAKTLYFDDPAAWYVTGYDYRVYDLNCAPLLPDAFEDVVPVGGYLAVRTADSGGLIDAKGSWIIKVPILSYLPD